MAMPNPIVSGFEWCEIRRWRGYVTSSFYAVTESGEVLHESGQFGWRGSSPPAETPGARAAYDAVVSAIAADGWTNVEAQTDAWYGARFKRPARVPLAPPVAAPVLEAAPVVRPPAPAPPPPRRETVDSPPPSPLQPAAAANPAEAGPRRTGRGRTLAIAGAAATLVAIAAAVIPSIVHRTPRLPVVSARTPAAAVVHRHVATRTDPQPAASTTTAVTPAAQPPALVDLRVVAQGNSSWLEVRRRSATGPTLYEGTLAPGTQLHLRGGRLWARFGSAGNLSITDNGRPVRLSGTEEKVFVP